MRHYTLGNRDARKDSEQGNVIPYTFRKIILNCSKKDWKGSGKPEQC